MSSLVVVVDPDSSVSYAMTLMRRRNIHSVVVDISEKNPSCLRATRWQAYGIVTTTDVRDKIVAVDRNPAEATVRDIMSGAIVTGRAEWTLMECSQLMQKY